MEQFQLSLYVRVNSRYNFLCIISINQIDFCNCDVLCFLELGVELSLRNPRYHDVRPTFVPLLHVLNLGRRPVCL
jgi:hypothetical protein